MNQKIKILVDGRWFDSFYSGVTTYIKGIYNTLAEDSDFSITVVGNNIEKLRADFHENIEFIQLNSSSNIKRLFFDIPNLILKHQFDYAHFQYISPFAKKCRYIVTLHDLLFLDYKKDFPLSYIIQKSLLFFISAKRSDILLTVSEFSKGRISHFFKIDDKLIHVIPNGVLKQFICESTLVDIKRKYGINAFILYVSRIEPRKNHLQLLKTFIELNLFEKYHLVLIGKKSIQVKELDNYLKSLSPKIKSKILFIENVSEKELYSFYSNASLFVYPSLAEGFGIPPLEAIASGTKTICSNATALADFSFLSKYQFIPSCAEQLKEKIIYALDDRGYPTENFKVIISEQYNWQTISNNFKQIILNDYSEILSK